MPSNRSGFTASARWSKPTDFSEHTSLPTEFARFSTVLTTNISLFHRRSPDHALGLGTHELSVTREEIQGYLLNVAVGLASVAIAVFGGVGVVSLAGYVYLLVFPLQTINGRVMDSRRRKTSRLSSPSGEEDLGSDGP